MLLSNLRDAIDEGKTAKLLLSGGEPNSIEITIRIKKFEEGYLWQRGEISQNVLMPSSNTTAFPTWDMLLERCEGIQTQSYMWVSCWDEIDDYLPQRRSVGE